MKTVWAILAIMMLVSFCSCGEKKQAAQEQTVRVKVQQIQTEVVNGEQGFSGTIEEQSGVLLSFAAVHVPISGWWGGSHAIKKKKLALDDAREMMEDNGQKLIIRMNNAWSAVETSHKKLVIAHDAIAQAEENLRLHKDYYRVGTTTMTDLLLAEEQYQQARDRYTDAYASLQTKMLECRQATGQN